jgi:hypothetical protein
VNDVCNGKRGNSSLRVIGDDEVKRGETRPYRDGLARSR